MSGHSKWHNIKVKKEKMDAKKGKMFTKVSKEILLAIREGGADPDGNYRLATAIMKAKEVNMPGTNIKRLLEKGSSSGGDDIQESVMEGYGPHGVAILLEVATDNKNRTVPNIRHSFSRHGGALGEAGCVSWMFEKKGIIQVETSRISEEELFDIAIESGADDLQKEEDRFQIIADPSKMREIKSAVEKKIPISSTSLTMIPKNEVTLDKSQAEAVLKLVEELEDNDDVQNVYANFDIPDDILEKLEV